jgi:hypothetical protein
MSGKALIIVVTGIIITTSIILYNIGASSTRIVENMSKYYSRQSAQDRAQSGVNLAVRRLTNSRTWRANTPWVVNMLGGRASIRAFDASYSGISNVVCVQSIGIEDYNTSLAWPETSTAYVWLPPDTVPTWSRALVNLNGANQMGGGIALDGRDYNPFSTSFNPGQGNWGVWSTGSSFAANGSSTVAGTNASGTDYGPQGDPADSVVIRLNQTYPGGFPTSPDSAFGYNDGTLKSLAQSGFGGSQYVTDPSKLTSPLRGVTYVDMPTTSPQNSWNAGNLKGTGILIVHNSAHNATITNANGNFSSNTGWFSGIVIADDCTHWNMDMWGAILILTQTPQGNIMGTGNATLRWSRLAMKNALGMVQNGSQVKVLAWYE